MDFVSEEKSRLDAVLKIQKVWRGFLIRKNLRTISPIRRKIDEIARRISLEETVQLIARDPKEGLGMKEKLMKLICQLDRVTGTNSGVKDCRKAVITRALSLQDDLDAKMKDHLNSLSLACQNVAEELVPTVDTNESTNSLGECSMDDGMLENNEITKGLRDNGNGDKRRDLNLMERVAEDNERLTGLMEERVTQSEKQFRMISALFGRVQQLERAGE